MVFSFFKHRDIRHSKLRGEDYYQPSPSALSNFVQKNWNPKNFQAPISDDDSLFLQQLQPPRSQKQKQERKANDVQQEEESRDIFQLSKLTIETETTEERRDVATTNDSETKTNTAITSTPNTTSKNNTKPDVVTPRMSSSIRSLITGDNNENNSKDAMIVSLHKKCKELKERILHYGDVDRDIENETLQNLEKEKYKLQDELKVTKNKLKFTRSALEEAMKKVQDSSISKVEQAETIDNLQDELYSAKLKCVSQENEIKELKERIQELESAAAEEQEEQRLKRQTDENLTNPSRGVSSDVSSVFEDDNTTENADDLSASVQSFSVMEPSLSVVEPILSVEEQASSTSGVEPVEPPSSSINELQEKYAKKVSAQLSLIAVLQEENEIKDIQLKNLRQQLLEEKNGNTTTKRRFAGWRTTTTNGTTATATPTLAEIKGNTESKVKSSTSKEEKDLGLTNHTNPFA
jgi:hypothetical protein